MSYIGIISIYIINNLVFEILFINRILNADVIIRKKHFKQNIDRHEAYLYKHVIIIKHVFFLFMNLSSIKSNTYRIIIFPTIFYFKVHE